jgi:hypothetical protein
MILFENNLLFKNIIFANFFETLIFLFINLFKYFPFFLSVTFLLQIRKFLLFEYVGGVWQNFIINKVELPYIFIDSDDNILYANESFLKIWQGDFSNVKNISINNIIDFEKGVLSCFNNEKIPINYEIYPLKTKTRIKQIILVKSLKEDFIIEEKKGNEEEYKTRYENIKILFQKLLEYFPKAILLINNSGIIED